MRRRREKNTLLPKMIGLAVIINAILLPILAQLGVFKNVGGQKLTPVEIIKLPPPEKRPAPPKKTAKKQAAKAKSAGRKTASHAAARRAPSGPPPVKVVAAGPAPGTNGGGNGDAGITGSDASPVTPPGPAPSTTPPPTPVAPPPPPVPPASASTPPPAPKPPAPPAEPTLTAAEVVSQPQPTLPSDLTYDDIHSSFFALFTIHADGTADVKMVSSTGSMEADRIALDTARQWKFRPATLNGKPVESYRRLEVEFYPT